MNLLKNEFNVETATMLAQISKEKEITLCGIASDQAEAEFRAQNLQPPDAVLIANDISVSRSLSQVFHHSDFNL